MVFRLQVCLNHWTRAPSSNRISSAESSIQSLSVRLQYQQLRTVPYFFEPFFFAGFFAPGFTPDDGFP